MTLQNIIYASLRSSSKLRKLTCHASIARFASSAGQHRFEEVVIVSAARTPVGSFQKSLAKVSASQLGATAIKAVVERAGVSPKDVEEVYMGNVISAGLGQAPARQAAIYAGLPVTTEATTVNKVCASGMKAVIFAMQTLALGLRSVVVAGGMESMSNVPFYFPRGAQFGNQKVDDGILKDGLWDVYNNIHMGSCAEQTARDHNITRSEQDDHAIESYRRAADAWKNGLFEKEVVPVVVKDKKGEVVVKEDDEYKSIKLDKVRGLKGAFEKDGTVTAANSSTLNDGASALLLTTSSYAQKHNLKPLARIVSFADAATEPKKFTIAPSIAVPIALERAGVRKEDVAKWEVNEAFSVVGLVNQKLLGIDPAKLNVSGGAVALGHPIGSSGSRIIVSLVHVLKKGEYGVGSICNGGGAASAIVIQRL